MTTEAICKGSMMLGNGCGSCSRCLDELVAIGRASLETFQSRVDGFMQPCFGPVISADKLERGDRLLEEVLELLQSGDYPEERAHALVEYVNGRAVGEPSQEVGGVMVTLAAYCLAHGLDMHQLGEIELARILQPDVMAKIRLKQAAKPTGSALPVASSVSTVRPWRANTFSIRVEHTASSVTPLEACRELQDNANRLEMTLICRLNDIETIAVPGYTADGLAKSYERVRQMGGQGTAISFDRIAGFAPGRPSFVPGPSDGPRIPPQPFG